MKAATFVCVSNMCVLIRCEMICFQDVHVDVRPIRIFLKIISKLTKYNAKRNSSNLYFICYLELNGIPEDYSVNPVIQFTFLRCC